MQLRNHLVLHDVFKESVWDILFSIFIVDLFFENDAETVPPSTELSGGLKNVSAELLQLSSQLINIEIAQIVKQIDFERKNPMDITEFSEYFENHRVKVIAELVKDYQCIGDQYLKSIEDKTVKNNTDT
jgi:hypothetical protein